MSELSTEVASRIEDVMQKTELAQDGRQAIAAAFQPHFDELEEAMERAKSVGDDPALARESRLELRRIRCDAERTRKAAKADSVRRGKAIDGINHVLLYALKPVEEAMEAIETAELRRIAAEREELNQKRRAAIAEEGGNPDIYNLADLSEDEFAAILAGVVAARVAQEEREIEEARIAAEKAEAERIERERIEAERAERERQMEEENRRLRAEAEEAERKAKEERAKREAAEAEERAKREAAEEEARKARAEAERIEREQREKERAEKEAEERKRAEAAEAQRQAELAPEREKLRRFAAEIEALQVPHLQDDDLSAEIRQQVHRFSAWIKNKARKL